MLYDYEPKCTPCVSMRSTFPHAHHQECHGISACDFVGGKNEYLSSLLVDGLLGACVSER